MPTEQELISRTPQPATRASLARQMRENGLTLGGTVLVHSSLSSLGWVAGGPVAVIQALLDCVGPQGTIVMPTHSGDLTDPADWRSPPVPADWVQILRNEMPAYDPQTTPTRNMGAVAELFRACRKTLLEAAITQPRPVFSCFVNLLQSEEARKQIILVIDGPAA
ncbi:AAC(3) family N-acetyltransferase [Klebsiella pneumoniae]|uniref:Aminoglycoside N(3)-acetyltransferase n=1 Tax=Klebsiella pneumoniae TaxID=573 RepID=A0A927HVY0_KLEPN|nr:AAC(3) family N-acetyltransferase [Klebsiella pneumoniae]